MNDDDDRPQATVLAIGQELEVVIGPVAHGGHFIAHALGNTIFVRGGITGERVNVRITSKRKRIYNAVVIHVTDPSPLRVNPPCSSSGECGGCDFQYIDPDAQRQLKLQVLRDSLNRFSGLDHDHLDALLPPEVLSIGSESGDASRSRARFMWNGQWNMRGYMSADLIPTPQCTVISHPMRLAMEKLAASDHLAGAKEPGALNMVDLRDAVEYTFVEGDTGVSVESLGIPVVGPPKVIHTFNGYTFRTPISSFWQSNPDLIESVIKNLDDHLSIEPGQRWWDLYSGAGVFAGYLAQRVGITGSVYSVEGSRQGTQSAKRAFHDSANISVVNSDVHDFLSAVDMTQWVDGVVLDPPRAGAGQAVCARLVELSPRIIVYLACDPVALGRDIKLLGTHYQIVHLTAFDAFPMTHHFETVVVFEHTDNLS